MKIWTWLAWRLPRKLVAACFDRENETRFNAEIAKAFEDGIDPARISCAVSRLGTFSAKVGPTDELHGTGSIEVYESYFGSHRVEREDEEA